MPRTIELLTPLSDQDVESLEIGDTVLVNGVIYTARDAAHKRLIDLLEAGKPLPLDLKGSDNVLCRAQSGAARTGHWCGRTDHQLSDGPVCPAITEPGTQGHDREGQTLPGGYCCHDSQ